MRCTSRTVDARNASSAPARSSRVHGASCTSATSMIPVRVIEARICSSSGGVSRRPSLAQKKVEATAGGGMVTVEANGKQEIVSIKIDPEVVSRDAVQMLEALILAASNEALRKSRELVQQEMGKITGGLQIPGLGM